MEDVWDKNRTKLDVEKRFEKAAIKWGGCPDVSVKSMCDAIAKAEKIASGKDIDPIKIQNYSPNGEYFMISFWFMDAITYLEKEGVI